MKGEASQSGREYLKTDQQDKDRTPGRNIGKTLMNP